MENKIEDHVIKCLSIEHGAEIIQYFKDLSVDTFWLEGTDIGYYYGFVNGQFGSHLYSRNSKVIELPKKMYSIQEIKSNSKIAILVDSQEDVDKLISINCFGAFNRNIDFSYLTLPCNKTWNFNFIENDYTIITLNQIKKFVLPEKWCILRTENNYKKVNEYFNKVFADLYSSDSEYIHNIRELTKHYESRTSLIIYANYTEITTEQFIEYVYNPKFNKTMEREIIGYKLIKPEYKEVSLDIMKIDMYSEDLLVKVPKAIENLKKAGVIDLWFEPVFCEEQFKVGDWVTWFGNYPDKTAKIYKYNYDDCYTLDIDGTFKTYNSCHKKYLRLATKEEIAKLQEKVYTLGIDKKFEIVVRNKKAYYGSEDVTNDLRALQRDYKEPYSSGKYIWDVDQSKCIVNSVGCIKYKSALVDWLAINLT